MRPPGGISPDMENFANGVDVYKIWADMIAFDKTDMPMDRPHHFCAFCGRRDGRDFVMSHEDILDRFGSKLVLVQRVQPALASIMGDQMYVGLFETEEEVWDAFRQMLEYK